MNQFREPGPGSAPRDGDVVVARVSRSNVHYTVRQLPGIVQFSATVLDEALRLATRFARAHAVDVWYWEETGYRLVGAYKARPAAAGGSDEERLQHS